uniref:HMG box domain-containing protein n=1 Tax=Leersia perrieri TaxID=77586 RepID=A0A0D9X0J4_9ORYZ
MSSVRDACSGVRERLGYVQCSFCATVLLVSVPCSSVLRVVAVQCGRCSGILSAVNLPPPPVVSASELDVDPPPREYSDESSEDSEGGDADDDVPPAAVANKPPGRKQRTPSAYNCFVKEEIKRIKGMEPNITHKQAFSTAAKNWAHLPRI